jgi:hypothetical protein
MAGHSRPKDGVASARLHRRDHPGGRGQQANVKQLICKLVDANVIELEGTGLYRLPKSQGDLAGILV